MTTWKWTTYGDIKVGSFVLENDELCRIDRIDQCGKVSALVWYHAERGGMLATFAKLKRITTKVFADEIRTRNL